METTCIRSGANIVIPRRRDELPILYPFQGLKIIQNNFGFVLVNPKVAISLTQQNENNAMTTKLQALKNQLEALYMEMPQTHFQQQQRDKSAFLISREIERLENPTSYAENKNHWEGHEIRF